MAYTTINKPTENFNTKLYTGTGATNAITGLGFQPDFVWIKQRSGTQFHQLANVIQGVGKQVCSNADEGESSDANGLTAFGTDGFSVGSSENYNNNGGTFASWNWKANGAGVANTDGSRATTVSANTTSGFSVGTCASLATNNDTLGHGLGVVPKMIMVKNTASAGNWFVYHASLGNTDSLYLNTTGSTLGSTIWNNTTPTSSVFTMKGGDFATGESLVFYAFADVQGYSKFGSYIGNGSTDGTFVYLGFKPAFVLRKYTTGGSAGGEGWEMLDGTRSPFNVADKRLRADTNQTEGTGANYYVDFLSNGFKIRNADNATNNSGATYIYMAFAEAPLVGTNNVPCTAR